MIGAVTSVRAAPARRRSAGWTRATVLGRSLAYAQRAGAGNAGLKLGTERAVFCRTRLIGQRIHGMRRAHLEENLVESAPRVDRRGGRLPPPSPFRYVFPIRQPAEADRHRPH